MVDPVEKLQRHVDFAQRLSWCRQSLQTFYCVTKNLRKDSSLFYSFLRTRSDYISPLTLLKQELERDMVKNFPDTVDIEDYYEEVHGIHLFKLYDRYRNMTDEQCEAIGYPKISLWRESDKINNCTL